MSKKIQKVETKQQTEGQNKRQIKDRNPNSKQKKRKDAKINSSLAP